MFAHPDHSSRGLKASVPKWARTALTCSIESTLHRAADLKRCKKAVAADITSLVVLLAQPPKGEGEIDV